MSSIDIVVNPDYKDASSLFLHETSALSFDEVNKYQNKKQQLFSSWKGKIIKKQKDTSKAMLCYEFGDRAKNFTLRKAFECYLDAAKCYKKALSDSNLDPNMKSCMQEQYHTCVLKAASVINLGALNENGIITNLKVTKIFFVKQGLHQKVLQCDNLILQMLYRKTFKTPTFNLVKITQKIAAIQEYAFQHLDKQDRLNFSHLSASSKFSTKGRMILSQLASLELFVSNFYLESCQDKSLCKDNCLLKAKTSIEKASLFAKLFFELDTRFTVTPLACYAGSLHPEKIRIDLIKIHLLKKEKRWFEAIQEIQKTEAKIKNMVEVFVLKKKQKLSHIEIVKLNGEMSMHRAEIYSSWYKQNQEKDYLFKAIKSFSCAFNSSLRLRKMYGAMVLSSNNFKKQYAMDVLDWINASKDLLSTDLQIVEYAKAAIQIFKEQNLHNRAKHIQQYLNQLIVE